MARQEKNASQDLVYPVYLDVQMLVSFLAALEGGVSFRSEVAERVASAKKSSGETGVKAALPSVASLLGLSLSTSGSYKRESGDDESAESRFVREHTAASLFNLFRRRALSDGLIRNDPNELIGLPDSPSLVEVRGQVLGNPLRQTINLYTSIAPFFGISLDDEEGKPQAQRRPAKAPKSSTSKGVLERPAELSGMETELVVSLMKLFRRDAERSPVIDLLMRCDDNLNVILTTSRAYLSDEAEAYLLQGRFSVLGKITTVVHEDEEINLLRRTTIGLGDSDFAQSMFGGITGIEGLNVRLAPATVSGPALQVLPLAVFV